MNYEAAIEEANNLINLALQPIDDMYDEYWEMMEHSGSLSIMYQYFVEGRTMDQIFSDLISDIKTLYADVKSYMEEKSGEEWPFQ